MEWRSTAPARHLYGIQSWNDVRSTWRKNPQLPKLALPCKCWLMSNQTVLPRRMKESCELLIYGDVFHANVCFGPQGARNVSLHRRARGWLTKLTKLSNTSANRRTCLHLFTESIHVSRAWWCKVVLIQSVHADILCTLFPFQIC